MVSAPDARQDVMVGPPTTIMLGDDGLEVESIGQSHEETVVVIQTALTADELRPFAEQVARPGDYQVIHCHRRGYAGSAPVLRPGSMAAEVADFRALLEALKVGPVHVVGASYSAALALNLAVADPEVVRTLTVMEPPPMGVPSTPEFLAVCARLSDTFHTNGPLDALDEFLTKLVGPDWRRESERDLPGSVEAMERDAVTFFDSDLPALISWEFGPEDAARITCPVLYVGDSGPWFAEARERMLQLLPHAQDTTVQGAGHLLALTHPDATAELVLNFLRSHQPFSMP